MKKLVVYKDILDDNTCVRPCPFNVPYGHGSGLNYRVGSHLCKSCVCHITSVDDKYIICKHV